MRCVLAVLVGLWAVPFCPLARAAEHVTLRNGFELDCVRREAVGDKVRLYFTSRDTGETGTNYMEVTADLVVRVESIADAAVAGVESGLGSLKDKKVSGDGKLDSLTPMEMHAMLSQAGAEHHIDEDLLASVVRAESAGQVRAVSRTGAQGLMQLMPGTASALGVEDAFQPGQNISGGTAYLDALLTRYHENVAFALAAYNAGPGAVDKYHGVPPYRETRAYVARVIREFNRRKKMVQVAETR